MLPLIIIAIPVILTGLGIPVYEFEAESHGLPKIPYVPNILQTMLSGGGAIGGGASAVASSTGIPATTNPTINPSITNPAIQQNSKQNIQLTNKVITQTNQVQNTTISPISTVMLCGREQVEYSYDKTDMKTGGDIKSFTASAPFEVMDIRFINSTLIGIITNDKIDGCISKIVPTNQNLLLNLSGNFNGTISLQATVGTFTVTCYPYWIQNVLFDQYGIIVQKFDPPIQHFATCILS